MTSMFRTEEDFYGTEGEERPPGGIPGCGHEEAMVACSPCAEWLKGQPGVCEGRAFCSEDNEWTQGELTAVDDDGHRRDLCPGCLKAHRRAIDDEGRGDYMRDLAKDGGL